MGKEFAPGQIVVVIIVFATIIFSFFWCVLRLDHVETMSVRAKSWHRQIKELEDYREHVCRTRYRTDSDGDRRSYQDCNWETRTRTHNTWVTGGDYPIKPFWEANYTIGVGHYESRSERYVIALSDDREVWLHVVYSEAHYDSFPVRGKCLVGLNFINYIVKVEC